MTNRDKYKALHHDELIDRIVALEGQLEAVGAGGVGRAALAAHQPVTHESPTVPVDLAGLVGYAFKLANQLNPDGDLAEIELRHTIRLIAAGAPAAQPQPSGNTGELQAAIMTKVQEFASTWATVDGRFDDGTAMDRAEACKAEIEGMLRAALAAQPSGQRR